MTATQVFVMFLKTELSVDEYLYFMPILTSRRQNGRAKPMLCKNAVEKYLSEHRRTLYGFMTRLFKICPNLIKLADTTKIYKECYKIAFRRHSKYDFPSVEEYNDCIRIHANSLFIKHYRDKWHYFLIQKIVKGKNSYNSPFNRYYIFDFKLKEINGKDNRL